MYHRKRRRPKVTAHKMPKIAGYRVKLFCVCGILFFGSAFSIMTFIQDVSAGNVLDALHERLTGSAPVGITPVEMSFCVGLTLGILFFYNHIGRKKLSRDPTPVQLAMYKYKKDLEKMKQEIQTTKMVESELQKSEHIGENYEKNQEKNRKR